MSSTTAGDDVLLHYNQAAMKASHNSYQRDESFLEQLNWSSKKTYDCGCGALELDISQSSDGAAWSVGHKASYDKNYRQLSGFLADLQSWHGSNPGHDVITLHLDIKHVSDRSNFPDLLDSYIRQRLNAPIYSPRAMMEGTANRTLSQVAAERGWPTLDALKNHFILCLTGNKEDKASYAGNAASTRLCFADKDCGADTAPSDSNCIFFNYHIYHKDKDVWTKTFRDNCGEATAIIRAYEVDSEDNWNDCLDNGCNLLATNKIRNHEWATVGSSRLVAIGHPPKPARGGSSNPTIVNVRQAFDRVIAVAETVEIDRSNLSLPEGGHFQGIQRLSASGTLILTSSSDSEGYFVPCTMASGTRGKASSYVSMSLSFPHAGGCQTVGDYLVAGLENKGESKVSEIQIWNCSVSPPVKSSSFSRTEGSAGAVGLSSYKQGTVLAVATFDAKTIDFYTSEGDPFLGSTFNKKLTWEKSKANKTGWIDNNFGKYQNINLVTQDDGVIFMVAFDEEGGKDWMDLYSVDLDVSADKALVKLKKKHMTCKNGCGFKAGAGIFVMDTGFEVYAVKGTSGDHKDGSIIFANHFLATKIDS